MRFFLTLSIFLLSFQVTFGKSYYQRQLNKKRRAAAAIVTSNRQLRHYCSIETNYNAGICVSLRAQDEAVTEDRRIAAEKRAAFKAHCEANSYDAKCIYHFGLKYILYTLLAIPCILLLCAYQPF